MIALVIRETLRRSVTDYGRFGECDVAVRDFKGAGYSATSLSECGFHMKNKKEGTSYATDWNPALIVNMDNIESTAPFDLCRCCLLITAHPRGNFDASQWHIRARHIYCTVLTAAL